MAKLRPGAFFLGVDANAKPLEKLSMKATRKPAKGGLPNAIFAQAAVEDLPEDLAGVASEIHINFPWGSLLGAVAVGESEVLKSLRRIACPNACLEVLLGIDTERDRAELERLGIPAIDDAFITAELVPKYEAVRFSMTEFQELESREWGSIETSWAKRLNGNESRRVFLLRFEAI